MDNLNRGVLAYQHGDFHECEFTTVSTSMTTTPTTSESHGKFECLRVNDHQYITVDGPVACDQQVHLLDALLKACDSSSRIFGVQTCTSTVNNMMMLATPSRTSCQAKAKEINEMMIEFNAQQHYFVTCDSGTNAIIIDISENEDEEACSEVIQTMTSSINAYLDGTFATCHRSTYIHTKEEKTIKDKIKIKTRKKNKNSQ